MKIIDSLNTGFLRSIRAWKGLLIITLALLILSSLFSIPFRGVLKAGLGSSMVPEELLNGFIPDLAGDITETIGKPGAYFSAGFFPVILAGIIFYAFFSGGLFSYLRNDQGRFSVAGFLTGSTQYFWAFLAISLVTSLMIVFVSLLLIGSIAGIRFLWDTGSNLFPVIFMIFFYFILTLILSVFLLVADFTRAHFVAAVRLPFFKALVIGFKTTFEHFFSSVPMMVILILIQILFGWLVTRLIMCWKPVTLPAILLMFILFQIFSFLRILLKSWRYASVTSLMEINLHPLGPG